ncbi:hypothetical protein [Pedobacter sp. Hv1]|uniref:hypothetical protein n=1 Tax=Pedobacter sp. Hv1 TaxID=1740090 RepID=UPI0006D8C29C|nr:hypothetical protein [Pedobacter sp. Hv1]KQC00360.1 hypothetical protein AQF98_12805 [Pedobacter sp. Hv1]
MKIYLKLTLLLLLPFFSFAQNLSDAKSYKQALQLATKKEKPLLLIIGANFPPEMANKIPANKAIQEEDVVKKIKDNFIVYETNGGDSTIRSIISTYRINSFPTFLFMHANQDVFHRDFGFSPTTHKYLAMLDLALTKSKEKSISTIEKEYLANKSDYTLLKRLIELKKKNGITNNAELIEQYVRGLRIDDFNDYQTVLFILEAGPYVDGEAFKLAYTNRKIVDSIFKKEPSQTRLNMNNYMINNTMLNAVKNKNVRQAQAGANFARNSWSRDYLKGNKSYGSQMLYYYSAIKDTTNYLRSAVQHYDTYYMNISADSIKKAEEKEKQVMLERNKPVFTTMPPISKEKRDSILKSNPQMVRRTESLITSVSSTSYATELNNIAYRFYATGTKNINYLTKAMIWSKRAIELSPTWGFYDTLAHLYYAMGIYNEALATQKIASDMAKAGNQAEGFLRSQQAYEKMKNRTL